MTRATMLAVAAVFVLPILMASAQPLNIEAAARYSGGTGGDVLLVWHKGKLVDRSGKPDAADRPRLIFSGTKGFWTVLAAAADQDGIVRFGDRVHKYIPQWSKVPKRYATISELLHFTAGLEPGYALHGDSIKDRNTYALNRPLISEPGTRFHYGPAELQVYHEALRRALAKRGVTPLAYLQTRLLLPLRLPLRRVLVDGAGNPLLAAGFMLTPREWLEWGLFLMRGGRVWILPVIFQSRLKRCFEGSEANPMYGMGFWLNAEAKSGRAQEVAIEPNLDRELWPEHACISRAAPADLIASVGSGGQRLYVVPSRDLVIVRMGSGSSFRDAEFLRRLFSR